MSHPQRRQQPIDIVHNDEHDSDDDIVGSYLTNDLDFLTAWSSINTTSKGTQTLSAYHLWKIVPP